MWRVGRVGRIGRVERVGHTPGRTYRRTVGETAAHTAGVGTADRTVEDTVGGTAVRRAARRPGAGVGGRRDEDTVGRAAADDHIDPYNTREEPRLFSPAFFLTWAPYFLSGGSANSPSAPGSSQNRCLPCASVAVPTAARA